MTRSHKTGFVIPSQNEWIKAAYYDPSGGGTYSYWKYPTNPGAFGDEGATRAAPDHARPDHRRRHQRLDPAAGELPRLRKRPAPSWCPSAFSADSLRDRESPSGSTPTTYEKAYQGSLEHGRPGEDHLALGHARPGRQRGRVDRHDHRAAVRAQRRHGRVWRRLHGGIANAPVYQLWLSAVGLQPQDNTFYTATYPWLGIRIGVLGNLKVEQALSGRVSAGRNRLAARAPFSSRAIPARLAAGWRWSPGRALLALPAALAATGPKQQPQATGRER